MKRIGGLGYDVNKIWQLYTIYTKRHREVPHPSFRLIPRIGICGTVANYLCLKTLPMPDDKPRFMHCNFGWQGDSNGWYVYSVFDSTDCTRLLDDKDLGNKNFNYSWWYRTLIIE